MIDAVKARRLMPSTQRRIQHQEDRLREISGLIAEAARADRSSITILVYDYEKYYITKTLKDHGFHVIEMPNTEEANDGIYRFKYFISW